MCQCYQKTHHIQIFFVHILYKRKKFEVFDLSMGLNEHLEIISFNPILIPILPSLVIFLFLFLNIRMTLLCKRYIETSLTSKPSSPSTHNSLCDIFQSFQKLSAKAFFLLYKMCVPIQCSLLNISLLLFIYMFNF